MLGHPVPIFVYLRTQMFIWAGSTPCLQLSLAEDFCLPEAPGETRQGHDSLKMQDPLLRHQEEVL